MHFPFPSILCLGCFFLRKAIGQSSVPYFLILFIILYHVTATEEEFERCGENDSCPEDFTCVQHNDLTEEERNNPKNGYCVLASEAKDIEYTSGAIASAPTMPGQVIKTTVGQACGNGHNLSMERSPANKLQFQAVSVDNGPCQSGQRCVDKMCASGTIIVF